MRYFSTDKSLKSLVLISWRFLRDKSCVPFRTTATSCYNAGVNLTEGFLFLAVILILAVGTQTNRWDATMSKAQHDFQSSALQWLSLAQLCAGAVQRRKTKWCSQVAILRSHICMCQLHNPNSAKIRNQILSRIQSWCLCTRDKEE